MAVNLEELALKSIEQYAAFGVRLSSIDATLIELNRKNEIKEEKFTVACDKLSRLEEKLTGLVEDKEVAHRRINYVKTDLGALAKIVREQAQAISDMRATVEDHNSEHCDDCPNSSAVGSLQGRVYNLENPQNPLKEVRESMTSKWGYLYVKFITSNYGMLWMGLASANIILSFFVHYELIKMLWLWITLQ